MLEDQPDEARGDGGDDQEPGQALVRRLDLARLQRHEESPDDPDPLVAEVDEQRDGRGHMHADEEGQEEGLLRRLGCDHTVPAEERRKDNGVAQARHREELGDSLQQAQDDGLKIAQHDRSPLAPSRPSAGR